MTQFEVRMILNVDPDVWEGAGYDPIDPDVASASAQVAEWLRNALYAGPDHIATDVREVGPVEFPHAACLKHPVNATRAGFHVLTLASDGVDLVAEDQEGNRMAALPKTDPGRVVGDNREVYLRLLGYSLDIVGERTKPTA